MRHYIALAASLACLSGAPAQTWVAQTSGTKMSLRGISAVSDSVIWASGAGGTWLRTVDGGAAWHAAVLPGAGDLDFRGVQAIDSQIAWLLSSGPGDKSRIYKTADGGAHWSLLFTNPDSDGFLDAIAFRDANRGMVLGDPVSGQFVVLTTSDGGRTWSRQKTPPARKGEGAFAASNSCLVVRGSQEAWFGTGGPSGARVFRSSDNGVNWVAVGTPLRHDGAGAGIFSLFFDTPMRGIAVGGDYGKPADGSGNLAITTDGGFTWSAPSGTPPAGYRSAVAYLTGPKAWIATGTSGSDISRDDGLTWKSFDSGAYNAIGVSPHGIAWAAGPNGRVARLTGTH
ncbi:MAG: glycosyl hydrolase [Bryobacteraceae bacterium]